MVFRVSGILQLYFFVLINLIFVIKCTHLLSFLWQFCQTLVDLYKKKVGITEYFLTLNVLCLYAADFVLCLLLQVLKKVELFLYEQYCK